MKSLLRGFAAACSSQQLAVKLREKDNHQFISVVAGVVLMCVFFVFPPP